MATRAAEKKNVPAKKANQAVAAYDYGEDAGAGVDDLGREDLAIPFVYLLQTNSPELEEIDGAKAGMLLNTATKRLYEEAMFVPCHRQHVYTEWVPRDQGGGWVGMFEPDDDVVKRAKADAEEFGKYRTREGNDLVETFYVYGLLLDDEDGPQAVVLPFSSTKIKKYKTWMTVISNIKVEQPDGRRITPPMFAHVFRIQTVQDENPKGKFKNYAISLRDGSAMQSRLAPDDPIYLEARAFRELAVQGRARPDQEGAPKGDGEEDEIPF